MDCCRSPLISQWEKSVGQSKYAVDDFVIDLWVVYCTTWSIRPLVISCLTVLLHLFLAFFLCRYEIHGKAFHLCITSSYFLSMSIFLSARSSPFLGSLLSTVLISHMIRSFYHRSLLRALLMNTWILYSHRQGWCTGSVLPEEDPWYTLVPPRFQLWSAAPNRTTSSYFDHTEKKTHAVWASGQNGRVSRRQENSDCSSPEWVEKASWATLPLLDGHSEERPSSAQPYLGGCYRTGSE